MWMRGKNKGKNIVVTMSYFKCGSVRFNATMYCLPSKFPFPPWFGQISQIPSHVVPNDIPTTMTESMAEAYALNPENVLQKFLEANPSFFNPREIGRIIFHSPNVSPFANSLILFNSNFSSNALLFSFITAIDLDCLSIIDAIRYITQRLAIPTNTSAMHLFAKTFAHAYSMRNPMEWPSEQVVRDILLSLILHAYTKEEYGSIMSRVESSKSLSSYIMDHLSNEIKTNPPPIYFSSIPYSAPVELSGDIEHEGRFVSSWSTSHYKKTKDMIIAYGSKDKLDEISKIPLIFAFATQKIGIKNKPFVMQIQRLDNKAFGTKQKDGIWHNSTRTSYTLAFKEEKELLTWISSVNMEAADNCLNNII